MSKKGISHRKWSKEEKLRIIKLHLDEHFSIRKIEKAEQVNHRLVSAWVKLYREEGEEGLVAKKGNIYSALHTSKSLGEVERLRLVVAKQEVEIARLKRAIRWKGVV